MLIRQWFCQHEYKYLGDETSSQQIGLGNHNRIINHVYYVIYCPKCKKCIKDKNYSHINMILAKNKEDIKYRQRGNGHDRL